MNKPDLAGRHILVVEHEFILSLDICTQIEAFGGVVIGPAATLEDGYAENGGAKIGHGSGGMILLRAA